MFNFSVVADDVPDWYGWIYDCVYMEKWWEEYGGKGDEGCGVSGAFFEEVEGVASVDFASVGV